MLRWALIFGSSPSSRPSLAGGFSGADARLLMLFERIESEGLAHHFYLIGDGGEAAVIDTRRSCAVYVDRAARTGYHILHVLQTHRNEDYVVGTVGLAARIGAEVYHADAQFGLRVRPRCGGCPDLARGSVGAGGHPLARFDKLPAPRPRGLAVGGVRRRCRGGVDEASPRKKSANGPQSRPCWTWMPSIVGEPGRRS